STNAPYLVAVWDEFVHARHPIAVYRTFSTAAGRAVKVDVVAENGARWVRVNTIKNARLVMEFREIDSYLTSDEDELRPRLARIELDNSVLRMGRDLLAAAKANPISIPTPVSPQVTIRLTRLDPLKDQRIEETVQRLRDMGIDVQLGERPHPAPVPNTPAKLDPTTDINLDLSALIALISDISHSPLPHTEQDAHARFKPPQSYINWKRDRETSLARQKQRTHHSLDNVEGSWENSGQLPRALAAQAIQEMNKGILQEIHERISTGVTFWTTSEARHRCLQIVSKIGGKRERQRADALLDSTLCARNALADAYWEHSRYPTGFLPLVPVRVYTSILPALEDEDRQGTTFFDALAQTCTGILSQAPTAAKQVLEEIPPPQTCLHKLTVHTLTSMLAGASRGYTTLTTNKSSVKAMLKEMRRVRGRYEPEMGDVEKAALWTLDPRSLSEGMRSE
ncbi:hypothetical protein HD554DRAFT_2031279, partial [Boletus coccyginus]